MLGMEIDNSDDGAVLSKTVGKEEVVMKEEQSPQKSPVSPPPSSSSSPSSDEQLFAKNAGKVEQPRIATSRLKMVNSSSTTTSLEERANRRASIKKLIGERHLLDKKRENDRLAALIPDSTIQKYFGVNDQDMDPKQFFKNRVKTLAAHKAAGMNLYPNKFPITMSIPDFIQKYDVIKNNQFWNHHRVSLAGRLMDKYSLLSSANVIIYELVGSGGRVQVSAHARLTCLNEDDFLKCHSELKIGDYVGIRGFPGRNGVGKLIIVPYVVIPLSYCLHKMPPMHPNSEATDVWTPGSGRSPYNYVLNNPETRYRRRFLDLTMNLEVRDIYKTRAKAVSYVRHFLENLDFLEVETPMLTMVSGGAVAAARPFVTHHNKLNMKMFMRTTAEFYLKQLVAGGIERVYEIGKQFRNEGIDRTHNPEFTTCEFCMALADYNDLMELTEQMLSGMVKELTGGYKVTYHANGSYNDPIEIDFTPPFRRICLIEELEKNANLSIPKDLLSDESRKCLADACTKFNIICPPPQQTAQLLEKLVGLFVEDTCVNPTFIMDYPEMMSPFAKSHWSKPGLTECFKLFINKFELINAYTQENDPEVHHQRFSDQVKDRQSGDEEAMALDETFCMALEYGLPPNASCSLSIDKLTMLLTDSPNIKEVILFPAMKPRRRNEPRIQEETEATVINNNVEDKAEAEGFWKILKNARHRLSGFRY